MGLGGIVEVGDKCLLLERAEGPQLQSYYHCFLFTSYNHSYFCIEKAERLYDVYWLLVKRKETPESGTLNPSLNGIGYLNAYFHCSELPSNYNA